MSIAEHEKPRPRKRFFRLQIGLRALCLILVAVAVWMTDVVNRRRNAVLKAKVVALAPLASELLIDDSSRIAVVKPDQPWEDDDLWDLYLPRGEYRICIATRGILNEGPLPAAVKTAPIPSGRRSIRLDSVQTKTGWRIVAAWNGGSVSVDESNDWKKTSGSSSEGSLSSASSQQAADQPLELIRKRFMSTRNGVSFDWFKAPADGIALWIEPVKPAMTPAP